MLLGDPGSAFGSPVDSETTAELKDHVHSTARLHIVIIQSAFVTHLLPTVDETDLFHLDSFLLLERLLHMSHGVVQLKIEVRLSSRQGLDEDLHDLLDESSCRLNFRPIGQCFLGRAADCHLTSASQRHFPELVAP